MDFFKSLFVWLTGVFFIILFFPLTFLVWLVTLPADRNRIITHRILTWQSRLLAKIVPIWKINVRGREKANGKGPYVFISNHQSILDILLINSLCLNYKWVSKIENMNVPFLGWYLRMADYLTVDRGNKESKELMMDKALGCLKKGISVMMFPEGTRSVDREIGFFKRGAFQLAIDAGVPIIPILLDGSGGVLPKHGLIFSTGHKVRMEVFDPVAPDSFGTDNPDILSVKFSNFMKERLAGWRTEKS
ncbi:MAG TPA: lysophospholipid acyltransferase family protein [Bacteroidales bacterium]|jgi:1-acyl-sn-glycerol-3-phosphate acyltransferase|nr:lysophospholipid acyltransferase family protein [Bacteroidales bacterium]